MTPADLAVERLASLFRYPVGSGPLIVDRERHQLRGDDRAYPFRNGVIDFLSPQDGAVDPDQAPELAQAHDQAFTLAQQTGGDVYGEFDALPAITKSGHFRRMALLAQIDLGDLSDKVVVDFGTGPWGFGAIYPRLAEGGIGIGFDVSAVALSQARERTAAAGRPDIVFATSDGEFIPLADDSVDVFFGGEVIEHVRNPRLFVQEIARVCKPDAMIILTTPNRDAFAYRLIDQPYCVGPEHIALLDCTTFRGLLEEFCAAVAIVGYETSIGPDLDHMPVDEAVLESLQCRSHGFPELATGLIATARCDKDRFARARQTLQLREYAWNSAALGGKPKGRPLPLFGDVQGLLLAPGTTVEIPVSGPTPSLLFWGHDWSGFVEVRLGDLALTRDLYLRQGGFFRIDLPSSPAPVDPTRRILTIRPLGRKGQRSNADQVIFYKAMDYFPADAESASRPPTA